MSKLKSRKMWVWIMWTVYVLAALIITKQIDASLISWYGTVSVIYIGSNVVQKQILKGVE